VTDRPTGVGDSPVQGGGNATPDSRLAEVIGSQLMGRSGRPPSSFRKLQVEGWGSHKGEEPRNKLNSDSTVAESESPCKCAGGSHLKPFVERRYDADQTSRHT
jgi:hypothetical protein